MNLPKQREERESEQITRERKPIFKGHNTFCVHNDRSREENVWVEAEEFKKISGGHQAPDRGYL